jgi:Brp/Blh family beta-carotene 15,15'-monooxygenase
MKKLMEFQSNLFILISSFALLFGYGLDLNANFQLLLLALIFVVLLGVPHGSLDVLFAIQTFDLKQLKHWLKFIGSYVIAALLVISIWLIAPNIFFVCFLLLSALHFSDDLNLIDFKALKLSYGALIITLPSLLFSHELIDLYAMIIDIKTSTYLVEASKFITVPGGLYLTVMLFNKKIGIRTKLETFSVCALFLLLHPILAFSIYFCGMHSARHLIRSHFFLRKFTKRAFLNALIFPTIAVIILGIFTWLMAENKTLEVEMIRIIFIGLAALTVPHAWVLQKSNFQAWLITRKFKDDY